MDTSLAVLLVGIALLTAAMELAQPSLAKSDGDNKRPNILFLMADQMRADALGIYGNKHALTPHLDALGRSGVVFKHGMTSTPTCTPARAGILTGRSPWNHGMIGYGSIAPWYDVEMPRLLANVGYNTASLGKDHFGWDVRHNEGIPHGYQFTELYDGLGQFDPTSQSMWDGEYDNYDQWFESVMPNTDPLATLDQWDGSGWNGWRGRPYVYDEYYHPTAWLGRRAVDFLSNYNEDAPFFLKVSFHRPHSPYDPPQRVIDKVKPRGLPPQHAGTEWDEFYRQDPSCGPGDPNAWCGQMPQNETLNSKLCYAASVSFVDEQIGYIMAILKERGFLENTYIIFTADHGDGQGDHWHWRKGFPYQLSARVPFMISWPTNTEYNVSRSTVLENVVVELRDILHTAIDIGNATKQVSQTAYKKEDGKSLLCLLQDPKGKHCDYVVNPGPWREWLDLEHSVVYNDTVHWNALFNGEMKYVFRALDGKEELYNITADPNEMIDLALVPGNELMIAQLRGQMAEQFVREGRGSTFVVDNDGVLSLPTRPKGMVYSPNYPFGSLKSNAEVILEGQGSQFSMWKPINNASYVLLNDTTSKATGFCMTAVIDGSSRPSVRMDVCNASRSDQQFESIKHTGNYTGWTIMYKPLNLCLSAWSKSSMPVGTAIRFESCADDNASNSRWTKGASGRFCNSNGCIAVKPEYPKHVDDRWINMTPDTLKRTAKRLSAT